MTFVIKVHEPRAEEHKKDIQDGWMSIRRCGRVFAWKEENKGHIPKS
jgi:hypothetical protein